MNRDEVVRLYTEEGMTQDQVAEELGTGQPYVSQILSDRGVDTGFNGFWTDEEDQYLKNNYPPDNPEQKQEMINYFPDRKWKGIRDDR